MKRQSWFSVAAYALAVFLAAQAVYALTGTAPVVMQNGAISLSGPPNVTTLTTNGVVIGQGTSAVTASSACTTATHVLHGGSPPACSAIVDADVPNSITVDLAATATALAANGANCLAGNYPLGVDASGAVESCTAVAAGALWGTSVTDWTTNQTVYMGGGDADTTEARASIPVSAGTWGNLRVRQTTASGASNDIPCTVRRGTCGSESDATVTCTISGGASAAACSDTSNTTTTTAGQCLNVKCVTPAALSNNQFLKWSIERLG